MSKLLYARLLTDVLCVKSEMPSLLNKLWLIFHLPGYKVKRPIVKLCLILPAIEDGNSQTPDSSLI